MKALSAALLLLAGAAVTTPALAQSDYPKSTIRFINASSAGGISDIFARAVADELTKRLKQPVIIENRPGGGFNIASRACADADPDGYTFCVLPGEAVIFNPYLFKNLPYDPDKSIEPVMTLFFMPQVLAINADLNVKSVDDLVKLSKAKPGTMSYASPGVAHAAFVETFVKKQKGGDVVKVPFRGGGDAVNGMLTGATPVAFIGFGNLQALLEANKVTALVVDGEKRLPSLPNVPTAAELGYSGYLGRPFFALFAPAATPQPIVDRMRSEIATIISDPAFAKRNVVDRGLASTAGTAAELRDLIVTGRKSAEKVVSEAGMKAN
jgi:tripartite-type tricarboxylate transporter receptor subunit TctC